MSRRRVIPISADAQPGVIYGIQAAQGGPIKIGWVGSPRGLKDRLGALQIGNPDELRVVWTTPGGRFDERDIHHAFRHARIRGEWFDVDVAELEKYEEGRCAA